MRFNKALAKSTIGFFTQIVGEFLKACKAV